LSSKGKKKGEEKTGFPDVIGAFSPSSTMTDYIKRFFYQIIGIYFPAAILFLYLFLFWYPGFGQDPIAYHKDLANWEERSWPDFLPGNFLQLVQQNSANTNGVVQLLLFLIAIVILAEGINAVTARLTMLSPVITNPRDAIKFSVRNKPFPGISRGAEWPIWLNETSFPVSFSQFDRYYVSALEQDKRVLAGKIGWVSFYRNMVAVFAIIGLLQLALYLLTGAVRGYELYVFAAVVVAIPVLLFGYRAQIRSNQATFWDAFKRYELRKNLEIRYGDMTLYLGIDNKHKVKALEYMIDRWFLATDNTIQTISRYFLTQLEGKYLKLSECRQKIHQGNRSYPKVITNSQPEQKIIDLESTIREVLTEAYSDWNRGAYERVIAKTSKKLEEVKHFIIEKEEDIRKICPVLLSTKEPQDSEVSPTIDDWKTILGFYILENSLRTDAAYLEVSSNLSKWGWIIKEGKKSQQDENQANSKGNSLSNPMSTRRGGSKESKERSGANIKLHDFYTPNEETPKEVYDMMANLIRETTDPYQRAFFTIMNTLKIFNALLSERRLGQDQKEICFKKLKHIYCKFGGYEYDDARIEAEHFFDGIYQIGTAYLSLKLDGYYSNKKYYTGNTNSLSDEVAEDATITEITNLSDLELEIYHIDINGKTKKYDLSPDSPAITGKEDSGEMVEGKWKAESKVLPPYELPEQLRLCIKWKAPILQHQTMEIPSDKISPNR
jgi:hypothetical protein